MADKVREPGNLEYRIKQYNWNSLIELVDVYFEKYDKPVETFEKGLDLGREARQKIVYVLQYDMTKWVAFVGTESEIIQRLEENPPKVTD